MSETVRVGMGRVEGRMRRGILDGGMVKVNLDTICVLEDSRVAFGHC